MIDVLKQVKPRAKAISKSKQSKNESTHLVIGDPIPRPLLLDEYGEFRLTEFLNNRDQFLVAYPVGTFTHLCLCAVLELESIYKAMNLSIHYGPFDEGVGSFYIDRDDQPFYERMRRITVCFGIIKSGVSYGRSLKAEFDWNVCVIVMPNIGWLKRDAGIDYEVTKGEGRKENSKEATDTQHKDRRALKELVLGLYRDKPYINPSQAADRHLDSAITANARLPKPYKELNLRKYIYEWFLKEQKILSAS